MARRQYPSDIARLKTRPHVKIALDIAHHPRTAGVWAEPEARGMLVELLRIATESWAGRRGGEVALSRADLAAIAGRTQHAHNLRAVRALCARVSYPVRERGALILVTVENLNENQGWDSADGGVAPRSSAASESDSDTEGKKGASAPSRSEKRRRRDLASRLYTIEQLLPEPTEEALAKWEAAGQPRERGWWLPAEERVRLQLLPGGAA